MALLDRNGFYGSARFHKIAGENGIRAHVGSEIVESSFGLRLNLPVWLPHQHLSKPPRLPLLCETRECVVT
jgi:error-prone DNA polymerase